jgi:hydroxypyruvate reductase
MLRAGIENPRQFLQELFAIAVASAMPQHTLSQHLPSDTSGRAIVIGAGKAAAAMAAELERHWRGPLSGLVVAPYGHATGSQRIEVVEASHPVPDARGEQAVRRILSLVSGPSADDLVICLLSGGGSALLSLPAPGITLADKRSITQQLLRCGAAIDEINCVRKHLSAIKGGRLARACHPAQLITYAISDVPGDRPDVIASGPTVADPTTSAQALAILQRYAIAVAPHVSQWLQSLASETPKAQDVDSARNQFHVIATAAQALQAAAQAARDAGLEVLVLGDDIQGEARAVAAAQAGIARRVQCGSESVRLPCLLLSGGETTVTVTGQGRGGRNTEFLLALAVELAGAPGIYALAADTDGIDGTQDNAGALLAPDSCQRASALGLDALAVLHDNDSYRFFDALGDLVITGPTRTNVNDFRAVLILPRDE